MPIDPITGGLIATGAGQLIGGFFNGKGQRRAAQYQTRAQREAMQYQRQRDQTADQRYDRSWADYERRHREWTQRNFGGGSSAPASGGGGGAPAAAGVTIGDLMAAQPDGAAPEPAKAEGQAAMVPESLGDWADWRRYGVGA